MSVGQRGKWAEGAVKTQLKSLDSAECTYMRLPDARAGSFLPTIADFQVLKSGVFTLLEVKSVAHRFRLSHKNFSLEQVARMQNWENAGANVWVLVCHTEEKVWRAVPLKFFKVRAGGSWDLRGWPTGILKEHMQKLI